MIYDPVQPLTPVPGSPGVQHRPDCEYNSNVPEPVCTCPEYQTDRRALRTVR